MTLQSTLPGAIAQTATQTAAEEVSPHALQALPPLRLFHVFAGSVLLITALGLWAVPGSDWNKVAQLAKLFMTATAVIAGVALILPSRRRFPEVQLDPRAERLEVVERSDLGRIMRRETYTYDELSEVDVRDGVFIARDHQGRSVVELPLDLRGDEIDTLRAALGPSFARTA